MTNNNFSLLDSTLIKGTFTATIADFKEVYPDNSIDIDHFDMNPPKRSPYISVTLRLNDGRTLVTRWYEKRLSYIMRCLYTQFDNNILSLRELLNYARTHEFFVTVDIDPVYGYQVDYEA